MLGLGLIILNLIVSILHVNGCTVGEIDMSFITSEISCTFGETPTTSYQLRYMPCGNTVECQVDGSYQMALQQETTEREGIKECWLLAMESDTPMLSEDVIHDENAYIIKYTGGEDNRVTDFRFFCGDTQFDTSKTTCGQIAGADPPEYYLELYSSTICDIEPPLSSNSGLSGGWIFIIWYYI